MLLVFFPQRASHGKSVEQIELLRVGEERLVIVRAVQVHESVPELLEHGERRCAAVDELPVRARRGEDAFQDQLRTFARLHALFLELRVDRASITYGKNRLD